MKCCTTKMAQVLCGRSCKMVRSVWGPPVDAPIPTSRRALCLPLATLPPAYTDLMWTSKPLRKRSSARSSRFAGRGMG